MAEDIDRRSFLAARSPSIDLGAKDIPADQVSIPPPTAKVFPTACDYCIVGCGYKAYVWPLDEAGGSKADQNAFRADFPVDPASGQWVSPNMHNIVQVGGKPHHVVILPDGESAVNRKGNHSIRGGNLGLKVYNPKTPTGDRLQAPLLRVRNMLMPIPWDDALAIVAEVSKHVIGRYGEAGWGIKCYSYQFWENTYAITKLAFGAVKTPCFAEHDKPTATNDATGVDDAGVDGFSASYEDWAAADVLYVSGVDPYENQTVLFTEWIAPGGARIIFVNPRRSPTAAYAERTGGLHLQVWPGTDSVLNNAIARVILEEKWEDAEWIRRKTASRAEIEKENAAANWRRRQFGLTFEEYRQWLVGDDTYRLDNAARITHVPAERIRRAAELLARPLGGVRPRASFMLEKGNYWSFNFPNSGSLSALGLTCGAGSRPGRVISRAGGHQRGYMGAAAYPMDKSPARSVHATSDAPGAGRMPLNFDEWAMKGHLKLAWIIGTTWINAMAAGQSLRDRLGALTRRHSVQVDGFTRERVIETLKARVDHGGMVLVQQEIYANDLTEYADLVLPAATWGEEDFTRAQGERRLRIYSKFYDAPGDVRPDWWIVAQVAQRMGFAGFGWRDSNAVFEEAAARSKGGPYDYVALVDLARQQGKRAHEALRELSTTGLQLPARIEGGKLVGTTRLHDESAPVGRPAIVTGFKTASGKAIFMRGDWNLARPLFERFAPRGDELWVLNGRINEIWQSMYDDLRKPYIRQRYPANFLFISERDARARGIESGDLVGVENDDVVNQLGEVTKGSVTLIAYVTDEVAPGVTYTYAFYPGQHSNTVVPAVSDPVTGVYNYKIGKGRVRKLGSTPLKSLEGGMSFVPRSIG
jgi:arsenite oxidase large subunit